jgi:hypothetical protein
MGLLEQLAEWIRGATPAFKLAKRAAGDPPGDFRAWGRRRAASNSSDVSRNPAKRPKFRDRRSWREWQVSGKPHHPKFEIVLKLFEAPYGGEWTALEMEKATDGEVAAQYFLALKDGRISVPEWEKMDAIARAMGFPGPLWFRPLWWWQKVYEDWKSGADVDDKLQDREYEPSRHFKLLEEWGYDPLEPRGVCTLERAAQLLQVSEEEVLALLGEGELATSARPLDVSGDDSLEMIDAKLPVEAPGSAGSTLRISLSTVVDKA